MGWHGLEILLHYEYSTLRLHVYNVSVDETMTTHCAVGEDKIMLNINISMDVREIASSVFGRLK